MYFFVYDYNIQSERIFLYRKKNRIFFVYLKNNVNYEYVKNIYHASKILKLCFRNKYNWVFNFFTIIKQNFNIKNKLNINTVYSLKDSNKNSFNKTNRYSFLKSNHFLKIYSLYCKQFNVYNVKNKRIIYVKRILLSFVYIFKSIKLNIIENLFSQKKYKFIKNKKIDSTLYELKHTFCYSLIFKKKMFQNRKLYKLNRLFKNILKYKKRKKKKLFILNKKIKGIQWFRANYYDIIYKNKINILLPSKQKTNIISGYVSKFYNSLIYLKKEVISNYQKKLLYKTHLQRSSKRFLDDIFQLFVKKNNSSYYLGKRKYIKYNTSYELNRTYFNSILIWQQKSHIEINFVIKQMTHILLLYKTSSIQRSKIYNTDRMSRFLIYYLCRH
jgi:hypothetical protein